MSAGTEPISILDRRKIEAQIAGPLIKAFIEELGEDKALAVVHSVIGKLARQSGMDLAKALGGNTMADLARGLTAWAKGMPMKWKGSPSPRQSTFTTSPDAVMRRCTKQSEWLIWV